MKKSILLFSILCISAQVSAKTVSDFISEYPALAKNPGIKVAIQQGAIGNAGLDAMSNGATSNDLGVATQRLLAENGYEYARASLRDLAGNICSMADMAEVYSLREKDCQIIIQTDSAID